NVKQGNKAYEKENFTEAEILYRKSLDVNPTSKEGTFNLGNALFKQSKFKDALQQYEMAGANDSTKLASALHNMGNVFLEERDYAKAIDMYKKSLMVNPKDNETRYNLAYAQKKLHDQQQDQQNQDQEKDQQQQKQDQNKDQQDQQDQQKKQDQQQDQNKDQNKDQQQQQQQQSQQDQMSQENAQQILDAFLQDEKQTQQKVKEKQAQQMQKRSRSKNW
ncbi:MAG: tetratricopeptide repeat protein, partial [Bacteroidales bacterium]